MGVLGNRFAFSAAVGIASFGLACGGTDAAREDVGPVLVLPDEREPCADRNPLRNPYFGDLHVHTAISFDAAAWGSRSTPESAYRFARGEPLGLFPYDAEGRPLREVQLERPLDFAAVTDHAEFFAEVELCTDPDSPAFDTPTCRNYRGSRSDLFVLGEFAQLFLQYEPTRPAICSPYDDTCVTARDRVWDHIQDTAEEFYDRSSACAFTTFVAYEWSATTTGTANIHRNIIYRNRSVSRVPTSYVEAPTPDALWDALDATCNDTGTPCEVLAIPHNSNVGSGYMFAPTRSDGTPYDAEDAARRRRLEPLVEVYQHKGSSECIAGLSDPLASEDELCGFEQVHPGFCTGGTDDPRGCVVECTRAGAGGLIGNCVAAPDFIRGALRQGLLEEARVGVNPFQFGLIASTDTHSGASGHVEEESWTGHLADRDDTPEERLRDFDLAVVGIRTNSPGGLAVIWAEDKSRESLFEAMKRRETYGTSGTRPVVRFFGGFGFEPTLCGSAALVETGYAEGVPMGGELPPPPTVDARPRFIVSAERDPGTATTPGTPLQQVQIVKGWLEGGETREIVLSVAGDPDNGATVDLDTCEPVGDGFDSLCEVWEDEGFEPGVPAFYYVRVLENPTCRWSHRDCLALEVDCSQVSAGDPLAACCDGSIPRTIQERAWTSPIWYVP